MALDVNAIKLANLIDPEVLAPMIDQAFVAKMQFAPLATLDYTLAGRPGTTVSLPRFTYIGDAQDVLEGADIPIKQLTETKVDVTIKKAGIGVQITDESVLSGYGDPVGQAIQQIGIAIANKVDNDVVTVLKAIAAPMVHALVGKLTEDAVANALVKFGENLDGDKVLIIAPEQLANLRTTSEWIPITEMGVTALMSGVVGMIWGCQVKVSAKIVRTGVTPNLTFSNFIVKPGALRTFLKRDTMLESDRDIVNNSTIMTANKHYVAYMYDASKAIKITTIEG